MNDTDPLTDTERDILLTRCECGHTINDHGSIGHCWLCLDDGRPDCAHDFEDLLAERVARVVAARVAAAHADALAPILARFEALGIEWRNDGGRTWISKLGEELLEEVAAHRYGLRAAVAAPEPDNQP